MLEYEKARLKFAHYWFKTLGRWRSCPLICPVIRPHYRHVFWSWFGSFLAIFITSYLTVKTNSPLLMAPFGATSVVIFSFPDSPLAQPRNVIGGNLIGALVSLIFLHFLGSSPVTMAMAVSTSLAEPFLWNIALMQLTGTISKVLAVALLFFNLDFTARITDLIRVSLGNFCENNLIFFAAKPPQEVVTSTNNY